MKFVTKPIRHYTHLTLGMLLHYLGKLKSQILADIQQTWIKIQTNCIEVHRF